MKLTYSALAEIVGEAKAAHPMPEDWRDLPAAMRRRVEREALAAKLTPDQYWRTVRDAEAASASASDEAAAIAKAVRRR
ncbi:hypothetical protein [Agromyces indicus]|uniref:Uncharacterized protein n=1 Tax=Agromyces indicus TaxID=758919 RepID=A0ABU1FK87_9MICO|nr:hypothetical protein [Agromyces indicus]MDR5691866.1 hypothetical protein [Agromyces indicus]